MKIGVVGLGTLGLTLAALFSKHFKVYGVDISEARIKQIRSHNQFFEPQINEYLTKYGENLTVSSDYTILKKCSVIFIITQTPSLPNGKFDLRHIELALTKLHEVNPSCLAVISSTVNIGDLNHLKNTHKRVIYNPEFIKQGSILYDFLNPKFVLIGAYNKKDAEIISGIWHKFHHNPISIVKPVEAEIIKLSSNVSFTLSITFANAIGELCRKFDANSNKVLDAIYQDRRDYKVGLGFMGPCFCRDVDCFKATSEEVSANSGSELSIFLQKLNSYVVWQQLRLIKSYGKRKVGFLGISYKPNVPYIYNSQPIQIARQLLDENYKVYVYDCCAEENAKKVIPEAIFFPELKECIKKAEVLFVGTSNYSDIKTDKPIINPWKA